MPLRLAVQTDYGLGLQWQFTGTNLDGDAGTSCPIDVTVTKLKFM